MTSGSSHELREMVARLEAFSSLIYKEGQSSVCERMAYQWQTHHTLNVKNALVDHVHVALHGIEELATMLDMQTNAP